VRVLCFEAEKRGFEESQRFLVFLIVFAQRRLICLWCESGRCDVIVGFLERFALLLRFTPFFAEKRTVWRIVSLYRRSRGYVWCVC